MRETESLNREFMKEKEKGPMLVPEKKAFDTRVGTRQ